MNEETLRSKFLGSLIGTGVGDALGAFYEGCHRVQPEEIEFMASRQGLLTYTDDTHMMIGMAESLIERIGFDGEHMAHVFITNYEHEPFRGYGSGPPHIFKLIRSGEEWNKAAERIYPGGSFGNGAAMRIAPVGVLYHYDLENLKKVAHESSRITHAHALGKEGAALQAYAIALATDMDPSVPFDCDGFLAKLSKFVQQAEYRDRIRNVERLLGEEDRSRVVAALGNGIEAFNSVPAAIFSFLTHSHSFKESVLYAISLGGDTDTIGAMNGAISGAFLGIDAIPHEWRDKLENKEYIENLAEKLLLIRTNG